MHNVARSLALFLIVESVRADSRNLRFAERNAPTLLGNNAKQRDTMMYLTSLARDVHIHINMNANANMEQMKGKTMNTIMERDNETTQTLIIKFAHVLTTENVESKRAFARRMIAIYKNDKSMADVVTIARNVLRDAR